VQAPDNWLNYNRYSYCLNNPFRYNDETGEFWHIIAGAVIGGVMNLVANWDNVNGFWEGFTTVLVGAGAGAATAATGGAGAGFWAVAGVSAAGGAITSANNSIVAQTDKNFSGINNVNWETVGVSSGVGAVSGFASGSAGYWAANSSMLVNNVSSPVLRSAIVSPIAAGAGHLAGGTTANLFSGQDIGTAFNNSFDGLGQSMLIGLGVGVASTGGVSYANGINPWNGNLNFKSAPAPNDYNFTPDPNGDNVTLYRGTSGSENNNKGLFMTDNPEYAATYVQKGGTVVEITIPRSVLQQMIWNGDVTQLNGMYINGTQSYNEYMFNSVTKNLIQRL
jgi:hypothetical protein